MQSFCGYIFIFPNVDKRQSNSGFDSGCNSQPDAAIPSDSDAIPIFPANPTVDFYCFLVEGRQYHLTWFVTALYSEFEPKI